MKAYATVLMVKVDGEGEGVREGEGAREGAREGEGERIREERCR